MDFHATCGKRGNPTMAGGRKSSHMTIYLKLKREGFDTGLQLDGLDGAGHGS